MLFLALLLPLPCGAGRCSSSPSSLEPRRAGPVPAECAALPWCLGVRRGAVRGQGGAWQGWQAAGRLARPDGRGPCSMQAGLDRPGAFLLLRAFGLQRAVPAAPKRGKLCTAVTALLQCQGVQRTAARSPRCGRGRPSHHILNSRGPGGRARCRAPPGHFRPRAAVFPALFRRCSSRASP